MTPPACAPGDFAAKTKTTRRERFLTEMEQVVPWAALLAALAPHYFPDAAGRRGRPPVELERMLRMYFVQQWYGLADEATEDALYDSRALCDFVGIDLGRESVPDATTLLKFRRRLEDKGLTETIFETVNAGLRERGLMLNKGTLADATILAAPSSTKNKDKARDPQMHQTRKGNQWYFGMKAHIGVDADSGLVHTVVGTAANVADVVRVEDLLHGEEDVVFVDAGYTGADKRDAPKGRRVKWHIAMKRGKIKAMAEGLDAKRKGPVCAQERGPTRCAPDDARDALAKDAAGRRGAPVRWKPERRGRPDEGDGSAWVGVLGGWRRGAQGRPGEAQDDAVVLEAVEQGVDQGLIAEQVVPLVEVEVGRDDGTLAGVALLQELEQGVGMLGLEVHVAQFVNDEGIVGGQPLEQAGGGVIGERGVELVDQVLGVVEAAAVPVDQRLAQEADGQSRLPGAGRTDQDQVLGPLDEPQTGEGADVRGVDRRLALEGEGVQRPVPGQARLLQPVGEAPLLAVARLLAQEREQHRRGRIAGPFGGIQHPVQGLGHAGEAQLGEQCMNGRAHHSASGSWKNAPRTCLRISDSRRVRS